MTDYSEMKEYIERRMAFGLDVPELEGKEVLDLIAEVERLRNTTSAAMFEQLSAENEALRKDAERYRWLRDHAEAADWEFIGYQEIESTNKHVDALMAMGDGQ